MSDLFTPVHGVGAPGHGRGEGLTAALSELEESTARLVSLRQKVERIAHEIGQRQQAILAVEEKLASTRASADHDRATMVRLERELDGHTGLLDLVRGELASLAGEPPGPGT